MPKRLKFSWLSVLILVLVGLGSYWFWPEAPLPKNSRATEVIVVKHQRKLLLRDQGRTIKSYPISLGSDPVGHKVKQGDGRTPEGRYLISGRNPNSSYYLSLRISYPSARDQAQAAKSGLDPGGDIMIHGLPNGLGWIGRLHRLMDWTQGCLAVTNREMDDLWRAVPDGTPIILEP
jgi:murein L,D-transpeptidase YafK